MALFCRGAAKFGWTGTGGTKASDNCWGRADVNAAVSANAKQMAVMKFILMWTFVLRLQIRKYYVRFHYTTSIVLYSRIIVVRPQLRQKRHAT